MRISKEDSNNELSKTELEVLILLAAGNNYKEIAEKLLLPADTVKKNLKSMLNKMRTHPPRKEDKGTV